MLGNLNFEEKLNFLKNLLRRPSQIEYWIIEDILDSFPFNTYNNRNSENLNYFAIKIFRYLKESVNIRKFAERLGTKEKTAKEILNNNFIEVSFPAVSKREAEIVNALIIPIESSQSFSLEVVNNESLKVLEYLTDTKFFIIFDRVIEEDKSSYMLSVYAGLKFRNRWKGDITFTGVLNVKGEIEGVDNINRKIEIAREKNIPIIFPHESMKNINDLREFIENLVIPVIAIPGEKDTEVVDKSKVFKFPPQYLSEVFSLGETLVYTCTMQDDKKSFDQITTWLKKLTKELKSINENILPIRVGFSSKIVALSFIAGIEFSKARFPVEIMNYNNSKGEYESVCFLESDKDISHNKYIERDVEVKKDKYVENIRIYTKRYKVCGKGELCIKLPVGKYLDKHLLSFAYFVSKEISSLSKDSLYNLFLETSNPFAFALGYFVEDYVNLAVYHKDTPVYIVKASDYGDVIYLLNAFSSNMLDKGRAVCCFKEVSVQEARAITRNKRVISYISHSSTAEILSNLLDLRVEMKRQDIKLPNRCIALIFQLTGRLPEGKILNREELNNLIERGNFKFFRLQIFY